MFHLSHRNCSYFRNLDHAGDSTSYVDYVLAGHTWEIHVGQSANLVHHGCVVGGHPYTFDFVCGSSGRFVLEVV